MTDGGVNRRAVGPGPGAEADQSGSLRVRSGGPAAMEPRMAGCRSHRFPEADRPDGPGSEHGSVGSAAGVGVRFSRIVRDRRIDKVSGLLHTTRRFWRLGSSMAEQLTLNQLVLGSSPSRGTTSLRCPFRFGPGCADPGKFPIRTPSSPSAPAVENPMVSGLGFHLPMATVTATFHPL